MTLLWIIIALSLLVTVAWRLHRASGVLDAILSGGPAETPAESVEDTAATPTARF